MVEASSSACFFVRHSAASGAPTRENPLYPLPSMFCRRSSLAAVPGDRLSRAPYGVRRPRLVCCAAPLRLGASGGGLMQQRGTGVGTCGTPPPGTVMQNQAPEDLAFQSLRIVVQSAPIGRWKMDTGVISGRPHRHSHRLGWILVEQMELTDPQ